MTKKPRQDTVRRTSLLGLYEWLGHADVLCACLDRRDLRFLTQVNRQFSRSEFRKVLFRRARVYLPSALTHVVELSLW